MKKFAVLIVLFAVGLAQTPGEEWVNGRWDEIVTALFGQGAPQIEGIDKVASSALLRMYSTEEDDSLAVRAEFGWDGSSEITVTWVPGRLSNRIATLKDSRWGLSVGDIRAALGITLRTVKSPECSAYLAAALNSLLTAPLPLRPAQDLIIHYMEYELWTRSAYNAESYIRARGTGWAQDPEIQNSFVGRAEIVRRAAVRCLREQEDPR